MRARNLKPGTFKNEILGTADPLYTILFEGLWCMADRAGRLEDRPLRICAEVFPYRRKISEKRADEMLWWLDENGFIKRYQIGAEQFIEVLEFSSHQNPHKDERPSEIQPFTPDLHRARTVPTWKSHRGKAEVVGLIPSSLTPDSGLLTPDSLFTDTCTPVQGASQERIPDSSPDEAGQHANGHEADESRVGNGRGSGQAGVADWEGIQRVQASYPKRSGRTDWGRAEHFCQVLIADHGETWASLEAAAQRYAEYTRATEAERTQHVLMPGTFFDVNNRDAPWRQAYELPQQATRRKTATDYDRESAQRLASLPGEDPGPM